MHLKQPNNPAKTPKPPKELRAAHASCLRGYDKLPDSAEVPVQVVAALNTVTEVTIWRWAKAGKIPQPNRRGGISRWNVGQLRRVMAVTE